MLVSLKRNQNPLEQMYIWLFASLLVVGGKVRRKTPKDFFVFHRLSKTRAKKFEETTISAVSRDDDQETWSWRIMKDLIVADRVDTKSFHTSLFS